MKFCLASVSSVLKSGYIAWLGSLLSAEIALWAWYTVDANGWYSLLAHKQLVPEGRQCGP